LKGAQDDSQDFPPPSKKTARLRWLAFGLALAFVVGIIFCADRAMLRVFFDWVNDHMYSDKIGHFGLIGGLAFMLNVALNMRRIALGPLRVALGGTIIGVLITLEEISQFWIPIRHFDLGDLAANYAGILCAGWLARWWLRKKQA
jgi:hypothetical protein